MPATNLPRRRPEARADGKRHKRLSHSADRRVPASFRDPAGFLFWRDGELFRQVNRSYAADYEVLQKSGLYEELVADGLLIPHEEVEEEPCEYRVAYRVIRPRRVPLISYPYEWCFSHWKEAALTTLRIQKRALGKGMWLKDASAYNVQLLEGRPVLIDTLSFERYPEGRPWVAYRQFCQHFLAPLAIMAHCDVRLAQLLRVHIDGLPLDLAAGLLPWWTRCTPGLALHLHAHSRSQRQHASQQELRVPQRPFSRRALELLLESLTSAVSRLTWRPRRSVWGDYYERGHNYSPESLADKERIVEGLLNAAEPETVWDLGANDGRFSRLASRCGALAVCWDADPLCVERNYQAMRRDSERNVVPLVLDLTNPSSAIGWAQEERMSLAQRGPADVVMALGLLHHLAIGNNVPLERIASYLARLGHRLIVEFVPKEDSHVRRLMASREDLFPDYHREGFERAFGKHFALLSAQPIAGSWRWIYCLERR
jgi:hypothetical protein